MTIRVPKKASHFETPRAERKQDPSIRSDRPRWPNNLPIAQSKAELELAKQDHLDYHDGNVEIDAEIEEINRKARQELAERASEEEPGSTPIGSRPRN